VIVKTEYEVKDVVLSFCCRHSKR